MYFFKGSVIRGLLVLLLGIVMILWPSIVKEYLVRLIGFMFLIPSLISLTFFFVKKGKKPEQYTLFPIDSLGAALMGIWLILVPNFFLDIMMYVLAIILWIGSLHQITFLSLIKKKTHVSWGYYVLPVFCLLLGILIFTNPGNVFDNIIIIFGVASIFYGVMEIINALRFNKTFTKTTEPINQTSDSNTNEEEVKAEEVSDEELKDLTNQTKQIGK